MQLIRVHRVVLFLATGLVSAALAIGQLAPVAQTGQTKCYDDDGKSITCKSSGQDGEFQYGVKPPAHRFVDNNDGTVTDTLTNVTWLKNADCYGAIPWQMALNNIHILAGGICGLHDQSKPGDWRMANIIELQSLLDYGRQGFALPPDNPFQRVSPGTYWTSTQSPAAPALAWFITLDLGPTVFDVKINSFHAWPVKGNSKLPKTGQNACWNLFGQPIPCAGTGQDGELQAGVAWPNPRFTDDGDGTVTDNLTGLIWLKLSNCLGFASFSDALKSSGKLHDGSCGLTDKSKPGEWRLPNIRELQSLQSYATFAPDLPAGHPFQNVQPTLTWASTSCTGCAAQGWFTIFGVGPSVFEDKAVSLAVWPVKGGARNSNGDDDDDNQGDE